MTALLPWNPGTAILGLRGAQLLRPEDYFADGFETSRLPVATLWSETRSPALPWKVWRLRSTYINLAGLPGTCVRPWRMPRAALAPVRDLGCAGRGCRPGRLGSMPKALQPLTHWSAY